MVRGIFKYVLFQLDRKDPTVFCFHSQADLEIMENISTEEGKRSFSTKLYKGCLQKGVILIRPDFIEHYVAKGSYQILSDELKIGWHPEYIKFLGNASNENVAQY